MTENIQSNEQNTQQNNANKQDFGIQRIYIKNLSFESPQSPAIFRDDWSPAISMDLDTKASQLTDGVFEVILDVTVNVKAKEKVAFVVEVQQAGIFTISGFSAEQTQSMLGSFCPNILFPYVREIVSDMVNRGTFPPLYLSPVNFDALYQQHLQRQQQQGKNAQQEQKQVEQPSESTEMPN